MKIQSNEIQKEFDTLKVGAERDLKQYSLELVGFQGEDTIDDRDINAIVIN